MRVLVIGINYAPEKTSVAPFTTGLCEHLASQGHEVTVITAFPYYPEWRVWDGYRGLIFRREQINGVKVYRVAHYVPNKPSNLIQRLAYDLSFALASFLVGLFVGGCDAIYCSSPPPTVPFAAYLLGKIKRAPHAIKLTDLASDAALATGIIKPGVFVRAARAFESFTYRNADAVICLCRGFIDRLKQRGITENKLLLISDWADTESIYPCKPDQTFRIANGLTQQKFLVIHTGNMGKKQCLINAVGAAELMKSDDTVEWLLVGQGEERDNLEQEILRRGLTNIRVLPLQPIAALRQMYASANLLLLNQSAAIEDAVIPSKLLTYMASGRPVVAAVSEHSEAARQINHAGCGVVITPETPHALAAAVLDLKRNPRLCEKYGVNGRNYAHANYTKSGVLRKYDEFFTQANMSVGFGALTAAANMGNTPDPLLERSPE